MQMPYVIQYLLGLHRSDNSPLVYIGAISTVVPAFPPQLTIRLVTDPGTDYALVYYGFGASPRIVPDAFYATVEQGGSRQLEGMVTEWATMENIHVFFIQTHAQPSIAFITNRSNLAQYYEGYAAVLRVATADDYQTILDSLERLGTSTKIEGLATQAVSLLGQMVGAMKPRPSLVGG